MRRNIFISIFVSLLVLSFSSKSVSAECVKKNPQTCGGQTVCAANNTSYCCASLDECKTFQGSSNTSLSVKCGTNDTGIQTAIGCIPILGANGTNDFLSFILKWAVGIGGGIAFLLMLYAGFMIMTASGNPERIKAGQELLTSAIAGLILLVFSIFILKFIGIDILGLGAFGFGTQLYYKFIGSN
jgi:hypothetical protein